MNLLTVGRLVLRAFLDDALRAPRRRVVEGETQLIADLLIVLEKTLWHGFRASRSMLAFRPADMELWLALRRMSAERVDVAEAVACVDQLQQLLNGMTKIRCLLRLVLMQKKMIELFRAITQSPLLREYYEPWALLRCEESEQLVGALLGLSVVDCALLIEHDHLMEQPTSVDLSFYIKIPVAADEEAESDERTLKAEESERSMLLDQISFLEERNRQLQCNFENAKAKLAEWKNRERDKDSGSISMSELETRVNDNEREMEEKNLKAKLVDAEARWKQERNRLHEQLVVREDALRFAEKRHEDTQKMKRELYENLREKEEAAARRERELVAANQAIAMERDEALEALESLQRDLLAKETMNKEELILKEQFERKCEQYSKTLNNLEDKQKELKDARELLESLKRVNEVKDKQIAELKVAKECLAEMSRKYDEARVRVDDLENTLEELGGQLSESKLRALTLREELQPAEWVDDSSVAACSACHTAFSITCRKHHCRKCGSIFCAACSSQRVTLPSSAVPVRVCKQCHHFLKTALATLTS